MCVYFELYIFIYFLLYNFSFTLRLCWSGPSFNIPKWEKYSDYSIMFIIIQCYRLFCIVFVFIFAFLCFLFLFVTCLFNKMCQNSLSLCHFLKWKLHVENIYFSIFYFIFFHHKSVDIFIKLSYLIICHKMGENVILCSKLSEISFHGILI